MQDLIYGTDVFVHAQQFNRIQNMTMMKSERF